MKRIPLEDRDFCKWHVLEYLGCQGKKTYYSCLCTGCGKTYPIRADRLTCGRTRQCAECRRIALSMGVDDEKTNTSVV